MTCQECELALSLDRNADEHLAVCASCRALVEELRANSTAFESFADDSMPGVRFRVISKMRARRALHWSLALAAAAAVALAILVPARNPRSTPAPEIASLHREPVGRASEPAQRLPGRRNPTTEQRRMGTRRADVEARPTEPQPLKVKMFTDDPDVVIYWLVEKKEKTE